MPLTYLLYRCPRCGHDTMEGSKDEARCPQCGVRFARSGEGARIWVREPSGGEWDVPATELTHAISAWEDEQEKDAGVAGPDPDLRSAALGPELIREAEVRVRRSGNETRVLRGGEFIGFAEAMGGAQVATLRLTGEGLEVDYHQDVPGEESTSFWPFLEIRAVQTSSSALQFSPSSGGLLEFRFVSDSSFRWERLLRRALRRAYRKAGLGEIVEFQPRVISE